MSTITGQVTETALVALENWSCGKKSRACEVSRDNGYGASCWVVKLHGFAPTLGKTTIECYEVSFVTVTEAECPPNVTFARPPWVEERDDEPTWPRLGATITAAIRRAEELGL